METIIKLTGVKKNFNDKQAVKGIDLAIQKGTIVALLGPNGAGKTTTVSMMLGLLKPTSGTVEVLGAEPSLLKVRNQIGVLMQDNYVIDRVKVKELINLYRSYFKQPFSLEELLKMANLEKEANMFTTKLSGGQKRRLGFALALAGNPSVLFLDEPTVGMDIQSRKLFWETVKAYMGEDKTVILTTHYLEEADQVADRVVVMNKGQIIADGAPSEIKKQSSAFVSFVPEQTFSKEFLLSLPTVERVEFIANRVKLYSTNTDQLITAIVNQKLPCSDIEIQKARLDEAFEFLTNETKEEFVS